ncbi:Minf_1886 family protein [Mucisphaera sp.]|uniref:Minf_1886 family protein n=1 Tax=Mucisphaera sp. TaxID=2913024 RepID=UPI003D0F2EA3
MPTTDLASLARTSRYSLEAFVFVQRGLDYTVRRHHGDAEQDETLIDPTESTRHVTGRQLCLGLRDFAIREYGLMAKTVLRQWGVTGTEDFGRIVFEMVESGNMHKTDEDSIEDFVEVYRFNEAFAPTLELSGSATRD